MLSELSKPKQAKPFSDFAPYIITNGLDEETSRGFTNLLEDLHGLSGAHWHPGDCRSIRVYLRDTVKLAANLLPRKSEVVVKHWMGEHYWLEIKTGRRLVVDPTGIPSSRKDFDLNDIHPFFGPVSLSRGFPRIVYTHGVDLRACILPESV